MTWPLAFFLGALVGLAIGAFLSTRGLEHLRDTEWTSGWVAGFRAARRAMRPGAKPIEIPHGVLPRMLDVRDDQEAGA